MKPSHALFGLLVLAVSFTPSCGYDCVDHACAEYTGDASSSGKVTICKHPQGDCEGCMGWYITDSDGMTLDICEDSEPGNCEPFMEKDARNYCTLGHTVGCGQPGAVCTTSGDCCPGLLCSLNLCG